MSAKSRGVDPDDFQLEPVPVGEWPGTWRPIHNSMKRKVHKYVWGRRCQYCGGPMLCVYRPRGGWIPIEPGSWEGSAYWIQGVHKFHGNRCEFWRKRKRFIKYDPNLPTAV